MSPLRSAITFSRLSTHTSQMERDTCSTGIFDIFVASIMPSPPLRVPKMFFEIPGVPGLDQPKPDPLPITKRKHSSGAKSKAEKTCKTKPHDPLRPNCQPKPAPKPETNKSTLCKKLSGARFRQLNELLYTCDSNKALKYFSENVGDFEHYHSGWKSQQQSGWKIRPIDIIASTIISDFKNSNQVSVADMGCGEAVLADLLSRFKKYHVHSFDLVSTKPSVIACDTSQTPLTDNSCMLLCFRFP